MFEQNTAEKPNPMNVPLEHLMKMKRTLFMLICAYFAKPLGGRSFNSETHKIVGTPKALALRLNTPQLNGVEELKKRLEQSHVLLTEIEKIINGEKLE